MCNGSWVLVCTRALQSQHDLLSELEESMLKEEDLESAECGARTTVVSARDLARLDPGSLRYKPKARVRKTARRV